MRTGTVNTMRHQSRTSAHQLTRLTSVKRSTDSRTRSPVQFTKPRYVRRDLELGGIRLKKGEQIIAMLVAANLDPHANGHPEKLDLERRPNRHIAFGTGIHFCLGHQLARMEGICPLKALFRRWPKLQLAVDGSEIKWRRRPGLRAIEHLPVTVLVRANAPSARADAPADSAKPVH